MNMFNHVPVEPGFRPSMWKSMEIWSYTLVIAASLLLMNMAYAQTRYVVINNQLMTNTQIAVLDNMACTRIPNGSYWVNVNTSAWGYAGNPYPQGRIGEYCHGNQHAQRPRRKSLSERGMLFSPGDWIR